MRQRQQRLELERWAAWRWVRVARALSFRRGDAVGERARSRGLERDGEHVQSDGREIVLDGLGKSLVWDIDVEIVVLLGTVVVSG